MKKILFLLCCTATTLHAQYWQQKVDTKIEVQLDDVHNLLHGFISMDYTNNSPDTLSFIYFHLYPNAYENDRTAYDKQSVENGATDFYFSKEEDRGYIDSLKFRVNDEFASIIPTKNVDVIKLELPQKLSPNQTIQIETPFKVKVPKTFSRMGHDGQSYQISQWFPKPAVYDQKGWHQMPYLDQGEFYSEFGTYDVSITLPENYIVMATGNLQNTNEEKWLDSLSNLPLPSDTLYLNDTPLSSEKMKTLEFQEENIHDFAWFADKTWIVRKEVIKLESGKEVTAFSCFFPKHQRGWKNSLTDIKTAILGYSKKVGEYPFKTVKAVEGALSAGGGMEYPTVTVIAATNSVSTVNTAVIHEVGHNWFYGILGSNERKFPWMDEGINSFYENKLTNNDDILKKQTTGRGTNFLAYALFASTHNLQAAGLPSEDFRNMNYGIDVYAKVPYFLNWLEAYMGTDTFKLAMEDYFNTWKFKHPQPEDFEAIFKKHTAKDINWFFKGLNDDKGVDFAIQSLKTKDNQISIKLKNKSGFEGPVLVGISGTTEANIKVDTLLWSNPFVGSTTLNISSNPKTKWSNASINEVVPDYRMSNNSSKKSIGVGLFGGLNMAEKHKFWVAPSIGYNYYDGFMAGLLFHNLTIPENKFQFALAPMYGFKSKSFVGTGIAGYTFYLDDGPFHDIQLTVSAKSFDFQQSKLNVPNPISSRFIKVAPELIFNFRKVFPRSPVSRSLSLKGYFIREGSIAYVQDISDSLYRPKQGATQDNFYGKLSYNFKKQTTFNPYNYKLEAQIGSAFAKISAEANFKIDYYLKNKAFYARFFVGKVFLFDEGDLGSYRYQLNTTYTGFSDYLYDETYISRSEQGGNTWQNQISMKEGGFKVNTLKYAQPLGLSNNWLFAMNLKTDIPFQPLPLRVFADVAGFTGAKESNPSGATILYEAGLELHFGEVVSIYLPLILSKDLNAYSTSILGKARFAKMIGFSLNLSAINWLNLPSLILK